MVVEEEEEEEEGSRGLLVSVAMVCVNATNFEKLSLKRARANKKLNGWIRNP